MSERPDTQAVQDYLLNLQDRICAALEAADGAARSREDAWERPGGGGGRTRVLADGGVFEQGGVNFSHVYGDASHLQRPPAARSWPDGGFRRWGCLWWSIRESLCSDHPLERALFVAEREGAEPVWWFGGGFDLTPYYGFVEDAVHWHRTAREACGAFGEETYPRYKPWCDEYFFLDHRGEARGVGGCSSMTWTRGGWRRAVSHSCARWGNITCQPISPIIERRRPRVLGDRERDFQQYRRGRYVEFNLVYDRGTLFGLQSAGRTESILTSLPPEVSWRYDWHPAPDSAEARLYERYPQAQGLARRGRILTPDPDTMPPAGPSRDRGKSPGGPGRRAGGHKARRRP